MTRSYIVEITDDVDKTAFQKFEERYGAEEVVRCKDCKWFSEKGICKHQDGGAGNIRPSDWFCAYCGAGNIHPADWFCADGERREKND